MAVLHRFYCYNDNIQIFQSSHTPFWEWTGAHGIVKLCGVLTKIGKFDIVLMYDVSIARLIPIIKFTLVYYEKRERKKQVWLYSIILWICKYVTKCSVFVYMKHFFFFFCQIGHFLSWIRKKHTFGIENGAEFRPQNRVIESPDFVVQ